jgi:hypothetical protein
MGWLPRQMTSTLRIVQVWLEEFHLTQMFSCLVSWELEKQKMKMEEERGFKHSYVYLCDGILTQGLSISWCMSQTSLPRREVLTSLALQILGNPKLWVKRFCPNSPS